jgi:putative tricarboxylic transport membrane protein
MDPTAVIAGLELILSNVWIIPVGVMAGMIVGGIPGLSPPNALAIMIPVLVSLPPEVGLTVCIALYAGSEMGNSFPAVMVNIPGTAAAAVTSIEGYPMRMAGKASHALGVCILGSTFGAILGGIASITFAPLLGRLALTFSATEICIIVLFGLTLIAQMSTGGVAKGLLAGFLGLMLATTGTDPVWGQQRATFGIIYLYDGITVVAALVGLLGFSELLILAEKYRAGQTHEGMGSQVGAHGILQGMREVIIRPLQVLRAALIGIGVGIIPGAGGSAASVVAYQQALAFAREKERSRFGKGSVEGLMAADVSNNAMVGGALVPLLTLGLPGSSTMVVVLVIMQYHGLDIGPRLFERHGELAYGLLWSQFFAAPFILIFGTLLAWLAYRVAFISTRYLVPVIGVFCIIGGFARHQILFDIGIMLGAGVLGYFMKKHQYPVIALLLGLLLGGFFEGNMFRGLKMGFGSPAIFFERPASIVLWIMLVGVLIGPPLARRIFAGSRRSIT